MTLDIKQLVDIVKNSTEERLVITDFFVDAHTEVYSYKGKVQAKERPRSGKGGRMFTPPATREFEKEVKQWAKSLNAPCVAFPIKVTLAVLEECLEPETCLHSIWGLTYNQKGDVDNLGKSILDGANGVLYKDDKQIVDLRITRRYSRVAGFTIAISRAGLTALEYSNFVKRFNK
jgi:Holliday junction resolvase RusA-like endonuclease